MTWRKSSYSCDSANCVEWRKSSYSCDTGNCVEFAGSDVIQVRDSKDPSGPTLAVDVDAWREFVLFIREDVNVAQ